MSVHVAVDCPHCSARNEVPSVLAGLPVTCAKCGESFEVPAADVEAAQSAAGRAKAKERARWEKEKARQQTRREEEERAEARRRESRERLARAREERAEEEAQEARIMAEPPTHGDMRLLLEQMERLTGNVAWIRGLLIFFLIVFLIGSCIAIVNLADV